MGAGQSNDKFHCNRYLNGKGPPSLVQQANGGLNGMYGVPNGGQPEGQMTWVTLYRDLPGFPNDNTLQLNFIFPDGIQTKKHPRPGQDYSGLRLCAYLPDSREGKKVFKLMERAFHQQRLFTVAPGADGGDTVKALVPLKTQPDTGHGIDGYPDLEYLKTVKELLKDIGIE